MKYFYRLKVLLMFCVVFNFSLHAKQVESSNSHTASCDFLPSTAMPEWVMSPLPADDEYLYGYGVASNPHDNISKLRNTSRNDARRDLSESLQVKIKSEVKLQTTAHTKNKTRTISQEANNYITSESDAVLESSEVVQLWLQPNSCNLWTKIRIKKKTVDTSAKVISQSVAASINENLQEIITKLDDVKKETSTDPRKELANRGIDFSPTSFAESLYRGDDSNIMLFLKAGMEYDEARDPYGENFEEMFYRTDIDKLSKSLKTLSDFKQNSFDLSYPLLRAITHGNAAKTKLFIKHGAKVNEKHSRMFDSYVWRRITFDQATALCFVNSRIAYFTQYPDKDFAIDDFKAIQAHLLEQHAESYGNITTNAGINEPRYKSYFNCQTNQQSSIK